MCAFVVYRSKISTLLGVITSAREEHKKSLEKMEQSANQRVNKDRKASDKHIEKMSSLEIEKQKQIASLRIRFLQQLSLQSMSRIYWLI